jgi:hypothetical protein
LARTTVETTAFVTQSREPAQPPDHLENCQPGDGRGNSLTRALTGNPAEQRFGHRMPFGLLVTLPLPVITTLSKGNPAEDPRTGEADAMEPARRIAATTAIALLPDTAWTITSHLIHVEAKGRGSSRL